MRDCRLTLLPPLRAPPSPRRLSARHAAPATARSRRRACRSPRGSGVCALAAAIEPLPITPRAPARLTAAASLHPEHHAMPPHTIGSSVPNSLQTGLFFISFIIRFYGCLFARPIQSRYRFRRIRRISSASVRFVRSWQTDLACRSAWYYGSRALCLAPVLGIAFRGAPAYSFGLSGRPDLIFLCVL